MLQDQPVSYFEPSRDKGKKGKDEWQKAKADKTALRKAAAEWEQRKEQIAQRGNTFGGIANINKQ